MDVDLAFARVVQRELDRRGAGIPWLSEASGIPERTLHNILRGGQSTVKLWQVCRISTALGVPCPEMVARADAMVEH